MWKKFIEIQIQLDKNIILLRIYEKEEVYVQKNKKKRIR